MMKQNYNCPCCGKKTLTSERMFDICPNCGWEDDNIQFSDPNYYGGANWFSLNKYRSVFLKEKNIDRVKEIQEESLNKFKEDSKANYAIKIRLILKKRITFGSKDYWNDGTKKELIDFVAEDLFSFYRFREETATNEENIILDESSINFDNCRKKWKRSKNQTLFDDK